VLQWLNNPAATAEVQQRFAALHDTLRRDTPALAAHAIEKVLTR
jgi:lipid-A-disaccharide synthase